VTQPDKFIRDRGEYDKIGSCEITEVQINHGDRTGTTTVYDTDCSVCGENEAMAVSRSEAVQAAHEHRCAEVGS